MKDDWNRWAGYKGGDLVRPDLRRSVSQRTAVERDMELAVLAEALGREWRRSQGRMNVAIRNALDVLAAR